MYYYNFSGDTDDNAVDFSAGEAAPRNGATAFSPCSVQGAPTAAQTTAPSAAPSAAVTPTQVASTVAPTATGSSTAITIPEIQGSGT
jgi:hypothetical protein